MKYLRKFNEFDINENVNEGFLSDAYNKVLELFTNSYFSKLFSRLGLSAKAAYSVFINDGKKDVNLDEHEQWVNMMIYMTTKTKASAYLTFIYDNKEYGRPIGEANTKTKNFYGVTESNKIKYVNEASVDTKADDKEMENISPDELFEVLEDHRILKTAPFIWGAPGIGKTQIVLQYAKKTYGGAGKSSIIILNLALMAPEDFVGLPMTAETGKDYVFDGGTTIKEKLSFFAQPFFLPRTNGNENKGGILFLDEYNRADLKILNASNSLILDGLMGTYKLPDKWFIVAAGNRSENYDRIPGIRKLGADQGSRFRHYNLVPTVEALLKFAESENGKMKKIKNFDEIEQMLTDYSKTNPKYTQEDIDKFKESSQLDIAMAIYLKNNPSELYTLGETDSTQLFASPRGWISASSALKVKRELVKASNDKLSISTVTRILKSVLGDKVTNRFSENQLLKYVNEDVIKRLFENKLEDTDIIPADVLYKQSSTAANLDELHTIFDLFLHSLKQYNKRDSTWQDSLTQVLKILSYFKKYVYQLDTTPKKFERGGKEITNYASEMSTFIDKLMKEYPRLKDEYDEEIDGNKNKWSITKHILVQYSKIGQHNIPKDANGNPIGNYLAV